MTFPFTFTLTFDTSVSNRTSNIIRYDPAYQFNKIKLTVNFVKNTYFKFYVSANGTPSSDGDWEEISLTSGIVTEHTFTNPGSCIKWKVELDSGSYISPVKGDSGVMLSPGIKLEITDYEEV